MSENKDSSDDWILLSNRLLLLQEIIVGLSRLPFAEVLSRAASGVSWIFSGGSLTSAAPTELSPSPIISRGRALLDGFGEVYLAYFEGPPEPRYLVLSGISLADPQEFRLAALYFEHLLAALSAAGYREELARQAHTDWLTGLGNRRTLAQRLRAEPIDGAAVGLIELLLPEGSTQAAADTLLKAVAAQLTARLSEDRVLHVGPYRFALFCSAEEALRGDVPGAAQREVQGELAEEAASPDITLVDGWALQREVKARTLAGLFEQAEVRLEGALAARWLEARAPLPGTSGALPDGASPVRLNAHLSGVRVSCGLPAAALPWQERVKHWPIEKPVTLLFDLPHGYALRSLAGETAPVLVVSDIPSEPYLYDLLQESPAGLIVGTPGEEAILTGLERVLSGETFYNGPSLTEDGLYPRERTVLRHVASGAVNAQIAGLMGISEKTVANYVTSLQDKLFLSNRVELVLYYLGRLGRS